MAINFTNGKTYRFINKQYNTKALNVYGTNAASTGRNVCLYTDTSSDNMQKWKYSEDSGIGIRLHSTVNNNYVLDRSDGSVSGSANNNAHLCAVGSTSAKDSALTFVNVSGNTYRIRLTNRINNVWLFLTAANGNSSPASSITTSNISSANGNVYWAEEALPGTTAYNKQCWTVEEAEGSSGGEEDGEIEKQTLCMPVNDMKITCGYKVPIYLTDPETTGNGNHYGVDYRDNRLVGNDNYYDDNVIASGNGYVYRSGYDKNAGYVACIVYPKAYIKTSSDGARQYKDITVRYWHMKKMNSKFMDVDYSFPISINKGEVIGTMGKEGVASGIHTHIECDTDTTPQYVCYTPTHWKSPDILKNGTDSTINPGWVFQKESGQTVKIKQDSISSGWVLDDYKYLGNVTIE